MASRPSKPTPRFIVKVITREGFFKRLGALEDEVFIIGIMWLCGDEGRRVNIFLKREISFIK